MQEPKIYHGPSPLGITDPPWHKIYLVLDQEDSSYIGGSYDDPDQAANEAYLLGPSFLAVSVTHWD